MVVSEPPYWAQYPSPPRALRERSLACVGIGAQRHRTRFLQSRILSMHGVLVVTRGDGWFVDAAGGRIDVSAPCAIWLFPGTEHGYGPDAAGWNEQWLLFAGVAADVVEELALVNRASPVVRLPAVPAGFQRSFDELRDAVSRFGRGAELRASIATQAAVLAIAETPHADQGARNTQTLLRDFTDEANLQLATAERAQRLGLSVNALRELTRSITGQNPVQLINTTRVTNACALLADTDLPLAQIGARVGIDDPAYFSRQFTRHMGVSPRVYREQQRGDLDGAPR